MTSSLFLRIKPLNIKTMRGVTSNASVIRVAAMHNLREIVAEFGARADSNINPARVALNYQLRGPDTAAGVADLAQALLDNAGVQKLRRDACMALELVFSLPQGSEVDHREYFAAAVAWADGFFNVPILSATVHLDEPAKHCHVLLLPLVAGRMQGGALAGGPTKIKMMLADFQQQVGQRFGLAHQPRAKRLSKANRDAAGRMVLDMLEAHPERLSVPAVRDALVAALGQHHETLLPLLDLKLPTTAKAKEKSFAAIMTAPCKPEPPAGKRTSIHVDKPMSIDVESTGAANTPPEQSNVYLCVHVASHAPAFPVDAHHQPGANDTTSQSAESSAHLDVSSSARISSLTTGPTRATYDVELVHHQADACDPSYAPRPKLSTTGSRITGKSVPTIFVATSAPCANVIRPHKDVSSPGAMCQGGSVSRLPAGAQNFLQTLKAAGGEVLKTEQVDLEAGHVGAHRRSFKGGAGIAPPTSSPDLRATGPPAGASP